MKLIIIFLTFISLYATNMQILAKHFEYNQIKHISKFIGDVNVTKEKDNILTDTLIIYTDKHKKLSKLIAIGNVKFKINDKNTTYIGKSKKLTYIKPKELFILEGNVHITQLPSNQQLFGEKVIIDKKSGTANIAGDKNKPLKFIIKVN